MYSTIKIKPVDGKSNTYFDFSKEINYEDPKFKIGDIVRISKYKTIFAKGYTQKRSKDVFMSKRFQSTESWTFFINDLNGEEIVRKFYENKCQKTNQKEKKALNYMLNGKDSIIYLTVGSIKQT